MAESNGASALQSAEQLSPDLTADYLEHHALMPLRREAGLLLTATWAEVLDERALDDLRMIAGVPVALVKLPEADVRAAIRRTYSPDAMTAEGVIAGLGDDVRPVRDTDSALDDLVSLANEAPVVKIVNLLLLEALDTRASDVHLETYQSGLRVRYRVDGVLQDAIAPPPRLAAAVVSRLKIMAELDIAERRVPQDGRIRLRMHDRQVDVRVSTLPTLHGESVVLRLLDKESGRIGLVDLGMGPETLARFHRVIAKPHGIVLATGPTGSGKTTTLYAALCKLYDPRKKIITIEDPVEYELTGINQIPVNPKRGLSFATGLRSILRQDPDIIFVGEIRDGETAEIAIRSALTGHLIFSTLHTNDAISSIGRLIDMGVEPYLAASVLEGALAQRLGRRICPHCRETIPIPEDVEHRLTPAEQDLLAGKAWHGAGCDKCNRSGFLGRVGFFELLRISGALRKAISDNQSIAALRSIQDDSFIPMRADGMAKAAEGLTTIEEVLRATQDTDDLDV